MKPPTPPSEQEIEELASRAILEGCYVCDKAEAGSVITWMLANGYTRRPSKMEIDEKKLAIRLADFFVYCLSHGAPYDLKDISKWSIAEAKAIITKFSNTAREGGK